MVEVAMEQVVVMVAVTKQREFLMKRFDGFCLVGFL